MLEQREAGNPSGNPADALKLDRRSFLTRVAGVVGAVAFSQLTQGCKQGGGFSDRGMEAPVHTALVVPESLRPPLLPKLRNEALERKLAPLTGIYADRLKNDAGHKQSFEGALSRLAPFYTHFQKTLQASGVPAEIVTLLIVESNVRNDVRSWVGAHGIAQLMAETATKELGMTISNGLGVDDKPFAIMKVKEWNHDEGKSPEAVLENLPDRNYYDERDSSFSSVGAMGEYLSRLYKQFGDWHLAICAYNCGPGLMRKRLDIIESELERKPTVIDYVDYLRKKIATKNCQSTRENLYYIVKFLAVSPLLDDWKKGNLAKSPQEEIQCRKIEHKASPATYPNGRTYEVQSGDTLSKIANEYSTTVEALKRANEAKFTERGSFRIIIGEEINLPATYTYSGKLTPEMVRQGINKLNPKDQISLEDFYEKYNPHAANPFRLYTPNEVNEGLLDRKTKRLLRKARKNSVLAEDDYQKIVAANLAKQPVLPQGYPVYVPERHVASLEQALKEI